MRSLISYLRSKASSCAFSRIISGLRIKQRVIYLPRFARNSRLPRDISRIKSKNVERKNTCARGEVELENSEYIEMTTRLFKNNSFNDLNYL